MIHLLNGYTTMENNEETTMSYDTSVNANEIATLGLLGRGSFGIGGGYGGGGHGTFASPSSNAVRIEGNRDLNEQGHNFISRQIEGNSLDNRFALIFAEMNKNALAAQLQQAASDLSNQKQHSDTQAMILKCCCEQKEAVANSTTTIITQMTNERNEAQRDEIAQLRLLAATNNGHHRGN